MFFNPKLETILLSDGTQTHVTAEEKEDFARSLNAVFNRVTVGSGKYLRHKSSELNVSEEMISRGPMFCNALMSRGYKNILFVGHFNSGQSNWMLDEFAGRMIDLMPPERNGMSTFPDLNIVDQSIPTMMSMFDYDCEFTVAPTTRKISIKAQCTRCIMSLIVSLFLYARINTSTDKPLGL